jgi:ceramide synthetase
LLILTSGHHIERLLEHLIKKKTKRNNFYIMLLHHYLTIILMVECCIHRQYICGIPILLIHDITDIFVNIIRLVREIKQWVWLTLPAYFALLFVWVFMRNTIFNIEIVYPYYTICFFEWIEARVYNHFFASFGTLILVVLNTFWLYKILLSGYLKIFKDKNVDLTEEADDIKKKSK